MRLADQGDAGVMDLRAAHRAGHELAQGRALRRQIAANIGAVLGNGEFCSTYTPNPDGTMRASVSVNGVARPEFESTVLWIEPDAGWTLALPAG